MEAQSPQGDNSRGAKTYDNQAREIQQNQRTTYRDWNHSISGTCMLSGGSMESICNYSGCLHGGGGDGALNSIQGCIQSAFKSGMRAGMHTTTAENSKNFQHTIRW